MCVGRDDALLSILELVIYLVAVIIFSYFTYDYK
jgi:hypothetical protein